MNNLRKKVNFTLAVMMLVASLAAVIFRKQIVTAYHLSQFKGLSATIMNYRGDPQDIETTFREIARHKSALVKKGYWSIYMFTVPVTNSMSSKEANEICRKITGIDSNSDWRWAYEQPSHLQLMLWIRPQSLARIEDALNSKGVPIEKVQQTN